MPLPYSFYNRPTLLVAQDLLDTYLIRKIGKKKLVAKITETEAYCGPRDKASHASRGRTPRTEIMFGPPSRAYIYLIYGMYWCLNIVTEKEGYPAAVLIRAIEPVGSAFIRGKAKPRLQLVVVRGKRDDPRLPAYLINGPGKVCHFLKIDKSLNGEDLVKSKKLWLEGRKIKIKPKDIRKAKRIGVDYAGKWADKKWRFYLKDSK